MSYTPMSGHMFIVEFRPVESNHVDAFGVVTRTSFQDRSYQDEVFECIAADDHVVVGRRTRRSICNDPVMLRRKQCLFHPISPTVLSALGLTLGGSA